jgi:hypothetical protein
MLGGQVLAPFTLTCFHDHSSHLGMPDRTSAKCQTFYDKLAQKPPVTKLVSQAVHCFPNHEFSHHTQHCEGSLTTPRQHLRMITMHYMTPDAKGNSMQRQTVRKRMSSWLHNIPESFRAFCRMVSLTAANTRRIFVVSVACVRLQ